jgi:hypothetical protein
MSDNVYSLVNQRKNKEKQIPESEQSFAANTFERVQKAFPKIFQEMVQDGSAIIANIKGNKDEVEEVKSETFKPQI